MKFGILIPLLIYYAFLILVFTFGQDTLIGYDDTSVGNFYNNNSYVGEEQTSVDWLDYAVTLLAFIGLGIGLPASTPLLIAAVFSIWQISINIIAVAMIVQVIRAS